MFPIRKSRIAASAAVLAALALAISGCTSGTAPGSQASSGAAAKNASPSSSSSSSSNLGDHLPPLPASATSSGKLFSYPSAYESFPVPYTKPTPLASGSQAQCTSSTVKWKKGDPINVIYVPPSTQYPYYQSIGQGLEKVIKHAGGTYALQAPAQDQVSLQIPFLRAAVQKHPTAIVMNTDSGQAVGPIVTQAEKAGIPVFIVNSDIPNFAVPIQGVIGYSQFQTDYIIGQYGIKLRKGQQTEVGVLAGAPDYFSQQRVGGFVAAAKTAPNFHIVSTLNGNWTTADSETAALNMLQAHPNIQLIFAANDYEALGVAQAAKSLNKKLIILGSDGDTDSGLQTVASGQITATMNTVPYIQGLTAGQAVLDCLNHTFTGGWVLTPGVLTTKSNIAQFLCTTDLVYPKPSAASLKAASCS